MSFSCRLALTTVSVLLFVGLGFLTPASAICTVSQNCFQSQISCTGLQCSHQRQTNMYWDYDCYPTPCCDQGFCVIHEIEPQAGGGCDWFCYQDNFAECRWSC